VSTDLLASTSAQVMDVRKGLATCVQGEIKPSEEHKSICQWHTRDDSDWSG
jgi:predicted transcriptional regulator